MEEGSHLQRSIKRATTRLAQLHAREIVAEQRKTMRAQQAARQETLRKRKRWVELVVLSGASMLDDSEIMAALVRATEDARDPDKRVQARAVGKRICSPPACPEHPGSDPQKSPDEAGLFV